MENGNKKNKLSLKNILLLASFGIIIIVFKYYLIRGDFCQETCANINSEIDIIKCLDACSINREDYREPVSNFKIILYSSIVIIFWILLIRFINNYERGNNNHIIIKFMELMKKFKDKLMRKDKVENDGYRKIE